MLFAANSQRGAPPWAPNHHGPVKGDLPTYLVVIGGSEQRVNWGNSEILENDSLFMILALYNIVYSIV